MKSHNTKSAFVVDALKRFTGIIKMAFGRFSTRVKACILALSTFEKVIALALFLAALIMLGYKIYTYYSNLTKLVPAYGGAYKEATIGEPKYINPILASSDVDTSVSRLIFSSLLTVDKDGNVLPSVAKSWEISDDKLKYTFTLRDDVYFHDEVKLTANDVVFTIDQIQNPNFQSPLYDAWKDVRAESISDNTLVFTLPKVYGPFIYNCDFGIVPSHIMPDELSKKFIGSGPYEYINAKKTDQKVDSIKLNSNEKYYLGRPYIKEVEIYFFAKGDEAIKSFSNSKVSGLSGISFPGEGVNNLTFETSKRLALMPNLRLDKFKAVEFRKNIFSDYKFPERIKLALTTLDAPQQRAKAEDIKKTFATRNIDLELRFMNPSQMKQVLDEKKYELLLYGFDYSHDPDPYIFWHTSQLDKLNFTGYSDKKTDKLLEEARMSTDNSARREKYNQFFKTVSDESLAVFYDPIKFNYYLSSEIKGSVKSNYTEVSMRYNDLSKWFIKEKRVKK